MKVVIVRWLLLVLASIFSTQMRAQSAEKFTLLFDFDKYHLTPKSKEVLDKILNLNGQKRRQIKLFGHTDAIGGDVYNDNLSTKRVSTAKKYLLDGGIPASQIVTDSGLGKRQPLNSNADQYERQANRRVEIIVSPPVQTLVEKIRDTATRVGSHILLQNLHFIGNRHVLMPESWPVMKELLQVMRTNPTLEIEIEGHVCCTGGKEGYDEDAKALMLSTNRAVYVYNYLVANGIAKKRLSWKAYGNSRPLYPFEDTQEKRMLNRRVEIKIVRK